MKITKKELKGLGVDGLNKKLVEARSELLKIRAQSASGANPKDLNSIKNLRKNIARILTFKKQMEDQK